MASLHTIIISWCWYLKTVEVHQFVCWMLCSLIFAHLHGVMKSWIIQLFCSQKFCCIFLGTLLNKSCKQHVWRGDRFTWNLMRQSRLAILAWHFLGYIQSSTVVDYAGSVIRTVHRLTNKYSWNLSFLNGYCIEMKNTKLWKACTSRGSMISADDIGFKCSKMWLMITSGCRYWDIMMVNILFCSW